MHQLRTIIIEDESHAREELEWLLKEHFPQVELVATAATAAEGIEKIATCRPNLLLLDIQLPHKSGMEMLAELGTYSFAVIFVTGHSQYMQQAIRLNALDYLLKPVQVEELAAALHRAAERLQQQLVQEQLANLMDFVSRVNLKEQRISLPLANEVRLVYPRDIMRCEARKSYTNFYLNNGEQILVAQGLYNYQGLSEYGFVQPSQQAWVNMAYIKSLTRKDHIHELLLLDGSTTVPISRALVKLVKDRVYNWQRKK